MSLLSEKPILQGVLWKRAIRSGTNWKKRYFKLFQDKLTYSAKENGKSKGDMKFTEEFFVQDGIAPKGKFGFHVTDFTVSYYLAADTKDQKDFWCHAIATQIRKQLERARYFEDVRQSAKIRDEDLAEKQYQARLENYYKSVGRPANKQNRKSMVDFRAAQVFAEAHEALARAETVAEAAERDRLKKEAERLAEEAEKLRQVAESVAEKPELDSVVVGPATIPEEEAEDDEEDEEDEVPPIPVIAATTTIATDVGFEEKYPPPLSPRKSTLNLLEADAIKEAQSALTDAAAASRSGSMISSTAAPSRTGSVISPAAAPSRSGSVLSPASPSRSGSILSPATASRSGSVLSPSAASRGGSMVSLSGGAVSRNGSVVIPEQQSSAAPTVEEQRKPSVLPNALHRPSAVDTSSVAQPLVATSPTGSQGTSPRPSELGNFPASPSSQVDARRPSAIGSSTPTSSDTARRPSAASLASPTSQPERKPSVRPSIVTESASQVTQAPQSPKQEEVAKQAPVAEPKAPPKVSGGIASRLGLWQNKVDQHQQKQANNVFSGSYQGDGKMDINKDQYGKAPEGSKTEERAKAAADWVEQEIEKLIKVILEMGEFDPQEGGITTVKFGPLFYKYADISDTLVGILMRAKKRKRIFYQGDMLFQTMHDHVKITVLK